MGRLSLLVAIGPLLFAVYAQAEDRASPVEAKNLRPQSTDKSAPSPVKRDNVILSWSVPRQEFAVKYYLDVVRLTDDHWRRVYGTYVKDPPYILVHALAHSDYAWRLVSIDAADRSRHTATEWHYFRTTR